MTVHRIDSAAMPRPYARAGVLTPEARELRQRMVANRRRRERHEAALEEVRAEAAALANEARGQLTYPAMAEALGISRAMVGYLLAPVEVAAAGG